jgi:RHS repeat-associated protein
VVGATANGSILNVKIERDAYGKEEALYGSREDAKYVPDVGYAGMYHHWSSGFNLTPNRWYDSRTGRWLSRDPIAENGGTNLYGYVGGNSLSYADPSGLWAVGVVV